MLYFYIKTNNEKYNYRVVLIFVFCYITEKKLDLDR